MPETHDETFNRGQAAGKRDARLDGHDDELEHIDTSLHSLAELVRQMGVDLTKHISELTLNVQALALNAKASADTALALAEGVEKERSSAAAALLKEKDRAADTIRMEKDKSDKTWTPFARFIAGLAAAVAIVGLYIQSRPGG